MCLFFAFLFIEHLTVNHDNWMCPRSCYQWQPRIPAQRVGFVLLLMRFAKYLLRFTSLSSKIHILITQTRLRRVNVATNALNSRLRHRDRSSVREAPHPRPGIEHVLAVVRCGPVRGVRAHWRRERKDDQYRTAPKLQGRPVRGETGGGVRERGAVRRHGVSAVPAELSQVRRSSEQRLRAVRFRRAHARERLVLRSLSDAALPELWLSHDHHARRSGHDLRGYRLCSALSADQEVRTPSPVVPSIHDAVQVRAVGGRRYIARLQRQRRLRYRVSRWRWRRRRSASEKSLHCPLDCWK